MRQTPDKLGVHLIHPVDFEITGKNEKATEWNESSLFWNYAEYSRLILLVSIHLHLYYSRI